MTCVECQDICSLLISILFDLNPCILGFKSNNETELAKTHQRGEKGAEIKVNKRTERKGNGERKSRFFRSSPEREKACWKRLSTKRLKKRESLKS